MTADVDGDKELLEPNGHLLGQIQGANNSVAAEHLSAEEDGVKINRAVNGIKAEVQAAVPTQPLLQLQQQQSQGASVHWERFLHLRSLRVLLVENDDSTRHVVSALLRNCSYEVIEASNALQAWKVLEDLTNHIDLILTEVVMPFFSGIALLSKIMSHKTRKNVPVIMMSSHDSTGLVFKCLSKGAVDFLVKPIRKNELKNLWQHVWRRCHSSSGSGSESGTQTQKSIKSKSIERSGNDIGSNDEEDNGSTGLNVGDGSDSGSGTQSSWTKQAAQIGSPQPPSPWDHIAECADSTCAQVIHSNAETSQNNQGPAIVAMKCEELENSAIDGDLEVGLPRNLNLPLEHPIDVQLKPTDFRQNNLPGKEKMENGNLVLNRGSPSGKERYETNNLAGIVTDGTDPQREITEIGGPDRISASDTKNVPNGYIENIELSLKRSRAVKDAGTKVNDDRNVLRRSDSSAFSRYNTGSHKYSLGNSVSGCGSPEGNNSKGEPGHDKQCHYEGDPPNQCSNVGSNNIDMCSTTNRVASVPASMKTLSMATSIVQRAQPSSYFHQLKGDMAFTPQQVVKEKTEEGVAKAMLTQRGTQQETQMQLHHHCRQLDHHFDQHDRLLRDVEQQQLPLDPEELSLKILAASAPHCGSSNVLGGNVEGNAGNYSINGSASGSNHGSNGPNGSSVAANAGGINLESDNGNAGKSGRGNAGGSGSGSGSGTEADQNKCAQREAALKKFRQKRNERCFRKKVRYQSRKKLAEQRPRVRGQFVRKTADDKTSEGTDS